MMDTSVPLLLILSDEVLVHLVVVGRLTLTDIGRVRATCKALRAVFGRIRSEALECMQGDLFKYRAYGHWDMDSAIWYGHMDLVRLLHEDEVKHGRVVRCTGDALDAAMRRKNWEAFVFLVRNGALDVELHPHPEAYSSCGVHSWKWDDLSREQVVFLFDEAQGFLHTCAIPGLAMRGPFRRGELDLVTRLLKHVCTRNAHMALLCWSFEHCDDCLEGFRAIVAKCRRYFSDAGVAHCLFIAAASHVGEKAVHLARMAVEHSPVALADMNRSYSSCAFDAEAAEYLRAHESEKADVRATCDGGYVWSEFTPEMWADIATQQNDTFVRLLTEENYDAAARVFSLKSFNFDGVWGLVRARAVGGLNWLLARGLHLHWHHVLSVGHHYALPDPAVTVEWVDAALQLAREIHAAHPCYISAASFDAALASNAARECVRHAAEMGDVDLLRHLCQRIDPFLFRYDSALAAVSRGHFGVIAYMADVNDGIAPVMCSEAARQSDVHSYLYCKPPFDLGGALEAAVRAGNMRMVRLIDRRLPGLRVSLAAACRSRRWRLFRFVLARLRAEDRECELEDAFLASVEEGHIEYVRWFEENEPAVVERCIPRTWERLKKVRDMSFWCEVLTRHPQAIRADDVMLHCLSYDLFVLERRVGVNLVARPIADILITREQAWAKKPGFGRKVDRGVLLAAVEFGVPLLRRIRPTDHEAYSRLRKYEYLDWSIHCGALHKWATARWESGELVVTDIVLEEEGEKKKGAQ